MPFMDVATNTADGEQGTSRTVRRNDLVAVASSLPDGTAANRALVALEARAPTLSAVARERSGPEVVDAIVEAVSSALDGDRSIALVAAIDGIGATFVATAAGGQAFLVRSGSVVPITLVEAEPGTIRVAEIRLGGDDTLLLAEPALLAALAPAEIAARVSRDLAGSARELVNAASNAGELAGVALVGPSAAVDSSHAVARQLDHLGAAALFRDLDLAQLALLSPYLDLRVYDAGERLVGEGTRGDSCLVLVEGEARVTRGGVYLTDIGPGLHLGETALTTRWTRSATVTAVTPVVAYELTRGRFETLLRKEPVIGGRVAVALARSLGERLAEVTQRLEKVEEAVHGRWGV